LWQQRSDVLIAAAAAAKINCETRGNHRVLYIIEVNLKS
jgi:hypothetical protein